MELARLLVGDPEEVHMPSLKWKYVWIKISCKNPNQIEGASEVFFFKKKRIKDSLVLFREDKAISPDKPDDDDDVGDSNEEVTDEEEPESQESQGWVPYGICYQIHEDTQGGIHMLLHSGLLHCFATPYYCSTQAGVLLAPLVHRPVSSTGTVHTEYSVLQFYATTIRYTSSSPVQSIAHLSCVGNEPSRRTHQVEGIYTY